MQAPWERILWSLEYQQKMYRDWGVAYSKKQQYDNATYSYNKALSLKDNDVTALYYRSLCYDDIAETSNALEDALKAFDMDNSNYPVNLQVGDAYYNSNMFESCKVELSSKMRKFIGQKVRQFQDRIDVVNQNCNDGLGDYAGMFLTKNRKYLPHVLELWHKTEDTRPLWKIQLEQDRCDVVSILEEEKRDKDPLEISKKNLYFKVFNQIYFRKGWFDVVFIRQLLKNKTLFLKQTKKSSPLIEGVLKDNYGRIIKFLRMLHARNPVYTNRFKMCPNQKLAAKKREEHLFRVQYQTRRDMFNMLAKMKKLRSEQNISGMIKFIEKEVGQYTAIKTFRIMPRKFEFINDVYNTVALTYIDKVVIPPNLEKYPADHRLEILLGIPIVKEEDQMKRIVFGDRSQYKQPNAQSSGYTAYKKFIEVLENRLKFVKYAVEKCYIYHELSRRHLDHRKFEKSVALAKRVIEEAENCKNYAWLLIGNLQMIRVHASQKEITLINRSILPLIDISNKLQNKTIIDFVEKCRTLSADIYRTRLLASKSVHRQTKIM